MSDRILLTGGAGYIGSHIYVELLAAGFEPVIFDNFSNSDPSVIAALQQITGRPVEVVRADVRNTTALRVVLARGGFAGVIHLAALKSVPESVSDPLAYFDCNLGGLISLVRAMGPAGVRNLVFSSSATVYGTPERLPIPEDAPLSHSNPYGFTKLASEQMLDMISASDPSWRIGILRYFNPAGAHDSGLIGEDPTARTTNLFPSIARVALGQADALTVFGTDYPTADGSAERDFIHVVDLAEGHVLSLRHLIADGAGHRVNLGTGEGHTVLEVLHEFGRVSGRRLPYRLAGRRPGDVARCVADPGLAQRLLGFRASRSLAEMCESSWRMLERRGIAAPVAV